jgi:lysophospholipase L1-like esterase
MSTRRDFLKGAGASFGALAVGACGGGGATPASPPSTPSAPAAPTPPTPPPKSAAMRELQTYLRAHAQPDLALPALAAAPPRVTWAGALDAAVPATTLPAGVNHPLTSPLIGGPLRSALTPGTPLVAGLPPVAVARRWTVDGQPRGGSSPRVHRVRTDAPVLEFAGLLPEGSATVQTLLVDGHLVMPTVLASSRGTGGGWNVGALRIDFGSRAVRDVWLETELIGAYVRIDAADTLLPVDDAGEPQLTVIGDSYLGSRSATFGNGGAIALELGARLGIRKVAIDAVGGTGYVNSNGGLGNLRDRLPGHAGDGSTIYLVMAGLNDYGDVRPDGTLRFPSQSEFEAAVAAYLDGLRAANPTALLVVTAPFCPVPSLSDSTYVVSTTTNPTRRGDFLFKSDVFRRALERVAAPWVWIDVLMGGGWRNSAGASGDATGLQWFTGGTPADGTTASYRPGNTNGGAGGGFGGIARVPVLAPGRYTQAPDIVASGGTGRGLLLAARIDASGGLAGIGIVNAGCDYTAGAGLPTLAIDATYAIEPATLGTPELVVGVNPNGMYPLPAFAPAGASAADLNNVYRLLARDTVHPSPLGVEYLSQRLARCIRDAVLAL